MLCENRTEELTSSAEHQTRSLHLNPSAATFQCQHRKFHHSLESELSWSPHFSDSLSSTGNINIYIYITFSLNSDLLFIVFQTLTIGY